MKLPNRDASGFDSSNVTWRWTNGESITFNDMLMVGVGIGALVLIGGKARMGVVNADRVATFTVVVTVLGSFLLINDMKDL